MSSFVKIEGHKGLVKDLTNGGVINIDKNAYKHYQMSVLAAKKNIEEKQTMQQEINNMKNDINEIKQMLVALINKEK